MFSSSSNLVLSRENLAPKVALRSDHLAVEVPPMGRFLALRQSLLVPYSCVLNVAAEDAPSLRWYTQGLGLNWPGEATIGTFYEANERRFCYFLKGDRVLSLRLHEHPFDRVYVGCEEADALARELTARFEKLSL